ncbi:hypothetical protein [Halapricum salinum]|uniref:Uncharacterized protein n=1 Tax=Halapricum salinum TaxID=1457250 RepID=A0A4D6HDD4_9EURY|nr:hypothetical protein [Halapricum salinum]QCC51178.1 hypothetical protein DV733_07955 [Halapricum salinum]
MSHESIVAQFRLGRLEGWRLDSAVASLSILLLVGIALDARAHASGLSFAEEGFFTPEHALFYSAFLGIAGVIGLATVGNRSAGADWIAAVPVGYRVGVLGVLVFGFGGVGDYVWHSTFGFEQGTEVLTSPTHLMLAVGGILFLSSPLRAAWRRDGEPTRQAMLAAVLSGAFTFGLFGLFSGILNPIANPNMTERFTVFHQLAIAQLMVYPGLFVGVGVALSRRFDLFPGSLTVIFLGPALMGIAPNPQNLPLVGAALAAGVVADVLVQVAPPRAGRAAPLRVFGAAVSLAFAGSYVLLVRYVLSEPLALSVHLWAGVIALAGLGGLVVTYLIVPDAARESTA